MLKQYLLGRVGWLLEVVGDHLDLHGLH
eukprot:SAG25_NODE_10372_length_337_cov_0.647059_1_plen_27_part_10